MRSVRKKDTDENVNAQIDVQTDNSVFYSRLSLGLMIGIGMLGIVFV